MNVVVSVQAKRSSARGLVNYIATSKIDPEREASGRKLFGERADGVSVAVANSLLTADSSKKRAPNEDLHHLVLSVKPGDYERLGATGKERRKGLQEIARAAMKTLAEETGAERLRWVGAVHLNTGNPHVHIAIHKDYFDHDIERRRMTRIPPDLLPHYEKKAEGGAKVLTEGRIAEAAGLKLGEISGHNVSAGRTKERTASEVPEKAAEKTPDKNGLILADALVAKHHLLEAEYKLESVRRDGRRLRFRVSDPATGKPRFASLSELEGERLAKLNAPRPKAAEAKTIAVAAVPSDAENRINAIVRRMIVIGTRELESRQMDYDKAAPPVEKLRKESRKSGRKMPLPAFEPGQLEELQSAAIERADFRMAGYLERVRLELAAREGRPSREPEELGRLKGQISAAMIATSLREQERAEMLRRGFYTRVETSRGNLSLADVERIAAFNEKAPRKRVLGTARRIAPKIAGKPVDKRHAAFEPLRDEIHAGLKARDAELSAAIALERKRIGFLAGILANDTNQGKESVPETLTPAQAVAAEQTGRKLLLPDALRRSWGAQKSWLESAYDEEKLRAVLAGRLVARRIIAGADLAKSRERAEAFWKGSHYEKFPVFPKDAKPGEGGRIRFLSLNDIGVKPNASVLDQALELFAQGSERRHIRKQIESAIVSRRADLKDRVSRASAIASDAALEADAYIHNRIQSDARSRPGPVFTRSEATKLERRAAETGDRREAEFLRSVLGDPKTLIVRGVEELVGGKDRVSKQNDRSNDARHQGTSQIRDTGRDHAR